MGSKGKIGEARMAASFCIKEERIFYQSYVSRYG
jgi:hypothetical protein